MVIDIPFFTQEVIPALNQGLKVSIALIIPASILGFVGGVALGCLRAFGGPWCSRLGNWYTAIIRGVPLAVQLMMIYYALPKMGIYFEPYGAALLSFILCSAAYHSEYIRGALLSIRQGQIKAAQALGMTTFQTVFWIVIPQAARRALPGCGNEIIYLIKYSSLAMLVTCNELMSEAKVLASDTFRKYFTDTYDQFYTQAEATVTTFQDQDKFEQQFLDANGRILLSTSGLSGGGVASTEDASQALSGQKTAVFTGRDPLSGERVMSVTAPLLSARGDLVGGVRYITSLRIVERQIWMIVGFSLLACLLFLMLVVASNSYFIRSIVDPVLKINTIAKEIAAGRYGVRLQKTYDDEIGELCDTINYMSDEISRAERMKNDFISSVSHELRTPLTAIGGWSETLLAGRSSRRRRVV